MTEREECEKLINITTYSAMNNGWISQELRDIYVTNGQNKGEYQEPSGVYSLARPTVPRQLQQKSHVRPVHGIRNSELAMRYN